jgi:NAD(P)-dependent dehydrogenase (short-subunit alcohol dehydrogenase family)/aryl carrier-like protein
MIDLDPSTHDFEALAAELAHELTTGRGADEVILRGGVRHVARLVNAPISGSPPADPTPVVRPGGSYLITGGLGGIGPELARWLASQGAEHLVLNGRSAPTPHVEELLTQLRGDGVRIDIVRGDIAEPGVAERLMASGEIRGVLHAAAIVDDNVLTELTTEQLARTWRPKVTGALRLHEAAQSHGSELDWLVMFSSGSALFGSMGLGAYAAANAWLDGFARLRRSRGLPALSVNWGPWAEVGLAVELGERGYATLPIADATDALRLLIAAGAAAPASIGVFPADPDHWFEPAPTLAHSSFFAAIPHNTVEGETARSGDIRAELLDLEAPQRRDAMLAYLRDQVQRLLDPDPDAELDESASLVAMGFDSLTAMRLRRRLADDLATQLPATIVWTHPTLAALGDHLLERSGLSDTDPQEAAR